VTLLDAVKITVVMTLVAVIQVSIVTPFEVARGHVDLVAVTLISIALLRGPVVGAVAGFWAGLILDTATLSTLGLTSLVLTLLGYWAGRFGEGTTRSSPHPPLIAVALGTVWVVLGTGLLEFMLGEGVPAGDVLGRVLLPTLALNLLVAYPVYRITCRLLPPAFRARREATALV
jgi:rod shape-determining protein MreD